MVLNIRPAGCPSSGGAEGGIEELEGTLSKARNLAEIGLHAQSLIQYDHVMATINRHIKTLPPNYTDEWLTVKTEIAEEVSTVKSIASEWAEIRRKCASRPAGAPAQPHALADDERSVGSRDGATWSPPPPLPRRVRGGGGGWRGQGPTGRDLASTSSRKGQAPDRKRRQPAPAATRYGSVDTSPMTESREAGRGTSTRNYSKPWLQPLPPQVQEHASGGSNDSGGIWSGCERRGFLEHVYGPSGEGPDADLIMMLERDCVGWSSISGLESARQLLEEAVVLPLLMPEYFQADTTFFNVSCSTVTNKYRGDSEKLIRLLFEMARFYAPTTIFFDEIDSIGSKRGDPGEHEASRRVKSELLVQMDGVSSTEPVPQKPQEQDSQEVSSEATPGEDGPSPPKTVMLGKSELWVNVEVNCSSIKLADDVDFRRLVKRTEGYSGADICNVCREASMMNLRDRLRKARTKGATGGGGLDVDRLRADVEGRPVTMANFEQAVKNVQKSVGTEDLRKFEDWMREFGSS
ncbi:Katanin p60 ATPase-containing subunit A1 [Perkinsus chesapeaki]|uniref:Katanin p60 ATPase-containing subunit A1 n=1 Tax=Perkinsus chesapeaki TaxID=330153 RepID=A0A7J6N3C4_PERCH|nr:Katanin p60 ATPase-containing subunit A1 [Perkinsus chesapeaki]